MSGQPTSDVNGSTANGQPRLTGWELLEDHFTKHDANIVDGFNKDIDTLLVFAGLFSAVLSAFVIVSLAMLQQDNGQTSVGLLLQISAQTANASQPAASLPDFHVPSSAVWINSLWFLSLILSLTSALFGMIAKQWLREYMEWTTTSWLPQRTITLRQKRFEAFEDWKVPAIIGTIPALLEVALILFFAGLIVFLCTFNLIVAGVSIATIATSISLAVLATILPVFRRRCPYKSPTGWACVQLAWPIAKAWERLRWKVYWWLPSDSSFRRLVDRLKIDCIKHGSWRERDLVGGGALFGKEASETLGARYVRYDDVFSFENTRKESASINLAALGRAFGWIRDTSQNEALLDAVVHCIETTRDTDGCLPLGSLAFDFSVACQAFDMEPAVLVHNLDQMYDIALEDGRVVHASCRHDWGYQVPLMTMEHVDRLGRARPRLFTQLAKMLTRDLNALLIMIYRNQAYENEASARFLMRIISLCALVISTVDNGWMFVDSFSSHFHDLLDIATPRPLPGLMSSVFELLSPHPENVVERPFNFGFAKLALRVNTDIDPNNPFRDMVDLFCHISGAALREMKWYELGIHNPTLEPLFTAMTKVVDIAHSRRWRDGGSYTSLYGLWIDPLVELFCQDDAAALPGPLNTLFPHGLIASLARCRDAALLTVSWRDHVEYLDNLLEKSKCLHEAAGPATVPSTHNTGVESITQTQHDPAGATSPATSDLTANGLAPSLQEYSRSEPSADLDSTQTSPPLLAPVSTSPPPSPTAFAAPTCLPDIQPPPKSDGVGVAISITSAPRVDAIEASALQEPQVHSTRSNVSINPAQNKIKPQDLRTSQDEQAQPQTLLPEEYATSISSPNAAPAALSSPGDPPNIVPLAAHGDDAAELGTQVLPSLSGSPTEIHPPHAAPTQPELPSSADPAPTQMSPADFDHPPDLRSCSPTHDQHPEPSISTADLLFGNDLGDVTQPLFAPADGSHTSLDPKG